MRRKRKVTFDFKTFDTEKEAKDYKKNQRWWKGTISYSSHWGCWILARSI